MAQKRFIARPNPADPSVFEVVDTSSGYVVATHSSMAAAVADAEDRNDLAPSPSPSPSPGM